MKSAWMKEVVIFFLIVFLVSSCVTLSTSGSGKDDKAKLADAVKKYWTMRYSKAIPYKQLYKLEDKKYRPPFDRFKTLIKGTNDIVLKDVQVARVEFYTTSEGETRAKVHVVIKYQIPRVSKKTVYTVEPRDEWVKRWNGWKRVWKF